MTKTEKRLRRSIEKLEVLKRERAEWFNRTLADKVKQQAEDFEMLISEALHEKTLSKDQQTDLAIKTVEDFAKKLEQTVNSLKGELALVDDRETRAEVLREITASMRDDRLDS